MRHAPGGPKRWTMNSYENNRTNKPTSKIKRFFFPADPPPQSTAELAINGKYGLQGQDIVTLSTQDWSDLWTRKQRFMLQFARQGNRVLYVESQFHYLTYIKRFKSQWRRIYRFIQGPRRAEPNLYIYTPPLLLPAFQIFPLLSKINNFVLSFFLKSAMRKIGIKSPLLWLYSHYNQPLIKKLGCKRALYECVDEFSGAKGLIKPEVARAQERATLKAVDVAVVTAPALKRSKIEFNRNIHVVPNAANVAHFAKAAGGKLPEPDDLKSIPRPRLVFIGGIAYWIDLSLLRYVAINRPSWQIVLIGPISVNTWIIDDLDNVHFWGRKPYDELPSYLAWCDIALNPYKVDSLAENCSPLKLYEYMAAGLPIVSTDMPEARQFPGIVSVASSYGHFVQAIEDILAWEKELRPWFVAKSHAEAIKHTWENRFLEVEKIAEGVL
jgi:glycosyltransferase involved in cell wall biosynthesis